MTGILIAIGAEGTFQVVGEVCSEAEAREMANNYTDFGQVAHAIAPERFEVHSRAHNGWYTAIEVLA